MSATALIVIDVQNDFCHPAGWAGRAGQDTSGIAAMLPRLARLIDGARAAAIPVVFVTLVGDASTDSAAWLGADGQRGAICRRGTWGAELMHVAPLPGEPVIEKTRYGAFHNTGLEAYLRERSVDTLAFAGVSTNICVESSIREAFMRDYHVVLASDCACAYRSAAHDATVENVSRNFGRVTTSDVLLAEWAAVAAPAARV